MKIRIQISLLAICVLFLFTTFLFFNFATAEKVEDLNASDYVNDYAGILTNEQKLELSKKLGDLEKQNGNQITVVVVKNMDGDYIEHFAVKLYEKWGIGGKEKDEGALFLISLEDRAMRIEVGYGLEPILTDGITKNILDNFVRTEFKNEKYFEGISVGIEQMILVLNGGILPEKSLTENVSNKDWFTIIIFIFIFLVNILGWLFAIIARTKSWWLGGVVTFIIGAPILYYFGFNLINDLILFIFTLTGFIFDYFISKNYKYWQQKIPLDGKRASPAWWAGGSWGPGSGGFSGSSSGFGGFGGGSSGGGGSSSSW